MKKRDADKEDRQKIPKEPLNMFSDECYTILYLTIYIKYKIVPH